MDQIQTGLASTSPPPDVLRLDLIKNSDSAFFAGMADDRTNLNDPPATSWESPFKQTLPNPPTPNSVPVDVSPIHGVIKVAGSDSDIVNRRLLAIQTILQRDNPGALIQDLPGIDKSRIDGQVRPEDKNLNGREQ